ncbi:YY1-associated factor 2 [Tyrophagus putrescentiae]|nr:YY1-associated factor 2 [Tyrophagus putrescentiae]
MSEDGNNTWECSVCTYHNSAEAFKCLMCDVRKGTSTRKPRINPEMVAKQVARQQEQIKQQALKSVVKGGKPEGGGKVGRRSGSNTSGLGEDTNSNSSVATDASSISGRSSPASTSDQQHNNRALNGSTCSNSNASTDLPSTAATHHDKINSLSSTASSSKSPAASASSSRSHSVSMNSSDAQWEDEVDENKQTVRATVSKKARKKTPQVTPVKPRLKNVDRDNVKVEEVTVNNLTVLITEFTVKRKLSEMSENQLASPSESPPKRAHKADHHQQSAVKISSSSSDKDGNNNSSNGTPGKGATKGAASGEGGKKTSPNKGAKGGKEKVVATVVEETAAPSKGHHSSPPKKMTAVADN